MSDQKRITISKKSLKLSLGNDNEWEDDGQWKRQKKYDLIPSSEIGLLPCEQVQFISKKISLNEKEVDYFFNCQDQNESMSQKRAGNLLFDDFMKIKKTKEGSYAIQNAFKIDLQWQQQDDPKMIDFSIFARQPL